MPSPIKDKLGRTLSEIRVSVTDRCNFRCGYCMPERGQLYGFMPRAELLSFEEVERVVRVMASRFGLRKVRLTGGEPLLRAQLERLVERLASVPGVQDLAMTTNGFLLQARAAKLARAGLHRVTVSLDSLNPAVFARATGSTTAPGAVLRGIEAAAAAGLRPIKINCVVQRGVNEDCIAELARHFRGSGHVVRFIEFMDVGTLNGWRADSLVGASEILDRLRAAGNLQRMPQTEHDRVARRYAFDDGSQIGVIASVSQPFCRDCNRARLTADGRLLGCLFASNGISLRDRLRAGASDHEIAAVLREAWSKRADRYSETRSLTPQPGAEHRKLEMYQVGG